MARFCSSCGTQVPDGAMACPACGNAVAQAGVGGTATAPAAASTGGLTDNVAGMLAYMTFVPAVVFLVMDPYNKNRFVRFHSLQCIFLWVAGFACGILLSVVSMIPFLGWFAGVLLSGLLTIGGIILWIVLVLKAYQGEMFKLPIIGDMAEKQA